MDRRYLHILRAILIIFVFLSGCNTAPKEPSPASAIRTGPADHASLAPGAASSPQQITENKISPEVFYELSSPKLNGRAMGTPGNEKARAIIKDLFFELGLVPFSKDFENPIFMNFSKPAASLVIVNAKDSADRVLKASVDYFIAPGKAYRGEYRVVHKEPVQANERVLYIVDEENEEDVAGSPHAAGYIYRKSPLYRSAAKGASPDLYLYLSPSLYDELKSLDGKATLSLDIQAASDIQTLDGSNLIGLIPGESHSSCLIFTAHYDGVIEGAAALDNASGIYGLLRIAEKLARYARNTPFPFDVVIGALDGEEKGLIGGGFLAEQVQDSYKKIIEINLDCIGVKGSDSYMAIYEAEESEDLAKALCGMLDKHGFSHVPQDGNFPSDHLPFEWKGIPAVTIGERNVDGIIHNEKDSADNVDTDEIERLSDALFEFVASNPQEIFERFCPN